MALGYFTIPIDANEQYQILPLDKPSQFILPVHRDGSLIGKGFILEVICSTNCTIKSDVSCIADVPWSVKDSQTKGWPIVMEEDLWSPCPDLPQSISITEGKLFHYEYNECIKPYRRIRLTVTPSLPSDERAKRLSYGAIRIELSII